MANDHAVDILTATIAQPPRLQTSDDPHLDLLVYIVDGIQPVERRVEWLQEQLPKTAAVLLAGRAWEALSEDSP